jgi:hypothetical protein
MTGVNFVTNDQGEKTALLIDLLQLKKSENTGTSDLGTFLDDLDDIIAAELSKGQKGRPYEEVRKEILNR